ncbi:hypothetical protein PpBr36_03384 [Pyricularia pennisetigena]|uniref:hypothetical protein n=1 Tax=Pyricularia pennisetigena TaxID=1578925 RepID=UPI0011547263|nr:hypothetical protein PpBr36_03384 [Pyricularia pennisetigena]TLS30559.1 hypothetical protein PpBr36_03384 [Pyricularia pennisetigena]
MMHDPSERPSKRARILSSINPYQTEGPQLPQSASRASPKRTRPQEPQPSDRTSRDAEAEEEVQSLRSDMNDSYSGSRPSKFRFKDAARKNRDRHHGESDRGDRPSRRRRDEEDDGRHRRSRRHDHGEEESSSRSHRHRHRRRRRDREEEKAPDPEPEDPFAGPPLDPDAAFRESLFDAMADDEGAAYWEGVYGQPIHTLGGGGGGELESMTEDEYAAHIRAKMWEKTHAGLLEARERRRRERAERDEERARDRRARDDAGRVDDALEARLRRGRDRRLRRERRERWARYCDAWARWDKGLAEDEALRLLLADGGDAWPVESGRRADVDSARVKAFFTQCLDALADEAADGKADKRTGGDVAARLKEERVRWHPDKIQQRLGGRVDEDLGRDVTAVFQIVDSLWSEMRAKK